MSIQKNDSSELYIIKASGKTLNNIKEYFEEFSIKTQRDQIVLKGVLVDHSAMMGLMERLYMLGFKLDSLERIQRCNTDN